MHVRAERNKGQSRVEAGLVPPESGQPGRWLR